MAYAEKIKNSKASVYCVISDGECQEGSTWEAAMMAANLQLTNLIVFVDWNGYNGMSYLEKTHPALMPITKKFYAFGWSSTLLDGHDNSHLFYEMNKKHDTPFVGVCSTTKGKGVSFMENNPIWHYRSPNKEEYEQAMKELSD